MAIKSEVVTKVNEFGLPYQYAIEIKKFITIMLNCTNGHTGGEFAFLRWCGARDPESVYDVLWKFLDTVMDAQPVNCDLMISISETIDDGIIKQYTYTRSLGLILENILGKLNSWFSDDEVGVHDFYNNMLEYRENDSWNETTKSKYYEKMLWVVHETISCLHLNTYKFIAH